MFLGAASFNQSISTWNTSNVTDMGFMFNGASAFNQNLGSLPITRVEKSKISYGMTDMLSGSGLSATNYNNTLIGWAAQSPIPSNIQLGATGLTYSTTSALAAHNTLTSSPNNWTITGDTYTGGSVPCFGENTKILCYDNLLKRETYMSIQNIRKGTLVKTLKHGYVPVDMIGKRTMFHDLGNPDVKNRLYKCSKANFNEIIDHDNYLILTGCHAILIDYFKNDEQIDKTREVLGRIFITDDKYRLPICLDERAEPYLEEGEFDIYHFALENDDYYMNYGVYANGLLVETCSKRYLKEESKMSLID
jgi:hypothetical protein